MVQVHRLLRTRGIDVSEAEISQGRFGSYTSQAVKSFQRQHGLPITGVVDAATAAALSQPIPAGDESTGVASSFRVSGATRDGVFDVPGEAVSVRTAASIVPINPPPLASAAPRVVIHQLTDLPAPPGTGGFAESLLKNARLRIEGTRNLIRAAKEAGAARVIAQSVAFAYAETKKPHVETDALASAPEGEPYSTVRGVLALEEAVTGTAGIEGIVLRYGYLYGPGTWNEGTAPPGPVIHVDAAAHAALLAMGKARPGIYNIAEDGDAVSSEKAKRAFNFDPAFRNGG